MDQESHHYRYIFGPVPSRRLGMSLGVDMVPAKTCPLNCAYCECGKTSRHTRDRKEYIPAAAIIAELDSFLAPSPPIDVITFAGSGEPTLNTALGDVAGHVRRNYPEYKTAALTNGVLLDMPDVRSVLYTMDFVLPSLDAISEPVFRAINRPVSGLTAASVIDGLKRFTQEYTGSLWVEVFIVPGVNDTNEELALFRETLMAVAPERVQLNTLDRPPAFDWVQPASPQSLQTIAQFLLPLPVEIISRNYTPSTTRDEALSGARAALEPALLRRPLNVEDVAVMLKTNINEASSLLEMLTKQGTVSTKRTAAGTFYFIPAV
jgi:wyosine [tRNA(Phe)-imidazoG37] synthetase (radical SAM superfamily)